MRKLFVFCLTIIMCVSICACSNDNSEKIDTLTAAEKKLVADVEKTLHDTKWFVYPNNDLTTGWMFKDGRVCVMSFYQDMEFGTEFGNYDVKKDCISFEWMIPIAAE